MLLEGIAHKWAPTTKAGGSTRTGRAASAEGCGNPAGAGARGAAMLVVGAHLWAMLFEGHRPQVGSYNKGGRFHSHRACCLRGGMWHPAGAGARGDALLVVGAHLWAMLFEGHRPQVGSYNKGGRFH